MTTTAPRPQVARAFRALLWRDVFVTGREFVPFLLQVVLQPVFLLFVFGKVLVELGFATSQYSDVLLPGVIALTAFLTALQNTAFPLVIDFSSPRRSRTGCSRRCPPRWSPSRRWCSPCCGHWSPPR
jgi:hypothetical protein